MKRVLVTGAGGFIGANLVRRLLADGYETHAICRPRTDHWRLLSIQNQLTLHEFSLTEAEVLRACVNEVRPNWVFHLAANGAYSWQQDITEMIASNITATANLLECAIESGVNAFVAAGSSSEYGFRTSAAVEDDWIDPNSEYAVMKACATNLCRLYAAKKALKAAVLRLYSVYGPYEDPDRFMPTLIKFALDGRLPPLVDRQIARDFVFVDDVVDAFIMTAGSLEADSAECNGKVISPGSVFNVGSGRQCTIEEVVELVREILEISEKPIWGSMNNRNWDTTVWVGNCQKIKQELGWSAKIGLAEGLGRLIEWSRAQSLKV